MTPTEVHELTVETALAEVLTESPASIAQRVGAAYERFAAPFNKRLVLCGAGHLGRVALPGVRAAGIEPVAFCDNNPNLHGTWIDGVPVLSPGAVALHGGDAAFLVTVYHPSAFRQQLVELGCARIVPYAAFYWKHWRALGHEEGRPTSTAYRHGKTRYRGRLRTAVRQQIPRRFLWPNPLAVPPG